MKKIHKIKTINDIVKVATSENYDRFTTDFMITIYNLIQIKENLNKEELKDFKVKDISWCDDNENRTGYSFNGGEVVWDKDKKQ
jgi:uncharacterized protein YfkK (UPF0435 family)